MRALRVLSLNCLISLALISASRTILAATKPQAATTRADRIAAYFHRPVTAVRDLRNDGFGYAEIVKILVIAEASAKPLPELMDLNRKGYGWGTISHRLGLDAVLVKKRMEEARRDLDIRARAQVN